jgi:hypothetical protein
MHNGRHIEVEIEVNPRGFLPVVVYDAAYGGWEGEANGVKAQFNLFPILNLVSSGKTWNPTNTFCSILEGGEYSFLCLAPNISFTTVPH